MPDILEPKDETRIAHGSRVRLHFSVSLPNGTPIDSTFARSTPVELVMGDGSLLEGFEKVLNGLKVGDTRVAHLPPSEAFGEWNADNVQKFRAAQFALTTDTPPLVGEMIEFADKSGAAVVGVVKSANDDWIEVDFNHPLAGQDVMFKVQIFSVSAKDSTPVKLL